MAKMNNKIKKVLLLATGLLFISLVPYSARAAEDSDIGTASTYAVGDPEVKDGDVVCFSGQDEKIIRCQKAYDEKTFGIYVEKPQVVLYQSPEEKPIVREGRAVINVTTINGNINAGDSLASSAIPGAAQKATEPIGFILGKALKSFTENDGENIDYNGKTYRQGRIEVALTIGPQGVLPRGTILDQLGYIMVKGTQSPQAAGMFLRYIMAGILTITVSAFAFNNYGRNINKGIESIGRNPLAKGQIQFAIALNTTLVAVLVIGSIILGLIIIRI